MSNIEEQMRNAKTTTVAMFPVFSGVNAAHQFNNNPSCRTKWSGNTEKQKTFISMLESCLKNNDLKQFSIDEIRTIASRNAKEINNWLEANGFNIKLDDFPKPTDYGTASIFDATVQWIEDGQVMKITWMENPVDLVPAAKVKTDAVFRSLGKEKNRNLFMVKTKNPKDCVYFSPVVSEEDCNMENPMDILNLFNDLTTEAKNNRALAQFATKPELVFPTVSLDVKPDISWLKEMCFQGQSLENKGSGIIEDFIIKQALQQTKFKLNEKGARAKSAAAIGVTRDCAFLTPPVPVEVLDKPFFVWFHRENTTVPWFAARIGRDSIKEVQNLDL